jgi:hypothetical protein
MMRLVRWIRGHQSTKTAVEAADERNRMVGAAALWLAERENALESARLTTSVHRLPDGVELRNGETAYLSFSGARLIKPDREPDRWVSPGKGISLWLAKGSSYQAGNSVASQDLHDPLVVDRGAFVVTSQRCLFVGAGTMTEWAHAKLLGFSLDGHGMAFFRDHGKAGCVLYGPAYESHIDAVVAAAIARFQSTESHRELIAELEAEVAQAAASLKALQAD